MSQPIKTFSPVSSAAIKRLTTNKFHAPAVAFNLKPKQPFRTPLLKPLADAMRADEAKSKEREAAKPKSNPCGEADVERVIDTAASKTDVLAAIDGSWLGRLFAIHGAGNFVTKPPGSSLIFANAFLQTATVQQLAVAYRFAAARVYDALQQDDRHSLQEWKQIERVEEVKSGIWQVNDCCIIGETGDIVDSKRGDWASFLEKGADLHSLVKTKDALSFAGGISTSFASRASAGEMAVAKRYVLSNSVGNR